MCLCKRKLHLLCNYLTCLYTLLCAYVHRPMYILLRILIFIRMSTRLKIYLFTYIYAYMRICIYRRKTYK